MPYLADFFDLNDDVNVGLKLSSFLLFLPIIVASNIPFYQTLLFKKHHRKILIILSTALLITVVLGFILTYNYGLYGIIFTLYITEIFVTGSMWLTGKKELSA